MTICIAAIVAPGEAIITASDFMLIGDGRSINPATPKFQYVGPSDRWTVMYSGNDFTDFVDLVDSIRDEISGTKCDGRDLKKAVREAFRAIIQEVAEYQILGPLGLTLKQFKSGGAKKYGDAFFNRAAAQIQAINLDDSTVLVAGFDSKKKAHIFSCNASRRILDHDAERFCAIGEGAFAARDWLDVNDDFRLIESYPHVAYRLCEAKYAAEIASSVGKGITAIAAHYPNGSISHLVLGDHDPPAKAWEKTRNADPDGMTLNWLAQTLATQWTLKPGVRLLRSPGPQQIAGPAPSKRSS